MSFRRRRYICGRDEKKAAKSKFSQADRKPSRTRRARRRPGVVTAIISTLKDIGCSNPTLK